MAGTEAKAMEEAWSPFLALQCLLSLLSYSTQDHLTRSGTTHHRLGPLTSLINKENAPQVCLQANLMELFPQLTPPCLRGPKPVSNWGEKLNSVEPWTLCMLDKNSTTELQPQPNLVLLSYTNSTLMTFPLGRLGQHCLGRQCNS